MNENKYNPKINYNECDCTHDWLLHSDSVKSIFSIVGGFGLIAVGGFIITLLLPIGNNIIPLPFVLGLIGIFGWKGVPIIMNHFPRKCDLCTCSKFMSKPRPYQ